MSNLRDCVVLLTGATGGIGRATAAALHAAGVRLYLTGRDAARLTALQQRLAAPDDAVACQAGDLCDRAFPADLVRRALVWGGQLDALVLCAGGARFTFFERLTEREFDDGLCLNLTANVRIVRAALPHLKARRRSWVVFVNTIASREPAPPRGSAYLTAKAGLRYFADTLFAEVRDQAVSVTSIMPDLTDTPLAAPLQVAPDSLIAPESVARSVVYALEGGEDACVTEIHLRPQRSLRREGGS